MMNKMNLPLPDESNIAWLLLEAMEVSAILVDRAGTVLFANETAQKKYARSPGELLNSCLWNLPYLSRPNYQKVLLNQAVQTGEPIMVKLEEDNHWNRLLIHPFHDNEGQIDRLAICSWDITPLVEAQEQNKRAALELISAQEEERHRISQDLHDDIGQRMTALALYLRSMETNLEDGRSISVEEIKMAIRDLETITKQTRQIFYQLHPPSLGTVAFSKVLEAFCTSFEYSIGIPVDFNCQMDIPELSDLQTTVLYRFVQEGFANIAKHAVAKRVWVSLDFSDGDLNISIEDDGKGYIPGNIQEGLGLRGIRERFRMLNGEVEIESAPGKGTRLFGTLPYEQKDVTGREK